MKTLNRSLVLGLSCVLLNSCASLKAVGTDAPVRTGVAFVRSTVDTPITRYRIINRARVVYTDKLLIASNAHDGLVAYDIKTGNRKWSYAVPNGVEKEPAVFNNRLYFGGNDGYFYSVNLESGQLSMAKRICILHVCFNLSKLRFVVIIKMELYCRHIKKVPQFAGHLKKS